MGLMDDLYDVQFVVPKEVALDPVFQQDIDQAIASALRRRR